MYRSMPKVQRMFWFKSKKQNPADLCEHTGRDICWVCNSKIRGKTALLGETGGCTCMQRQWYMARKIHM